MFTCAPGSIPSNLPLSSEDSKPSYVGVASSYLIEWIVTLPSSSVDISVEPFPISLI